MPSRVASWNTEAQIVSEIADISRFPNDDHLAFYAGLGRREHKTGDGTTERSTFMFNHRLKNTFFTAARNYTLYNPDSHLTSYYRSLKAVAGQEAETRQEGGDYSPAGTVGVQIGTDPGWSIVTGWLNLLVFPLFPLWASLPTMREHYTCTADLQLASSTGDTVFSDDFVRTDVIPYSGWNYVGSEKPGNKLNVQLAENVDILFSKIAESVAEAVRAD